MKANAPGWRLPEGRKMVIVDMDGTLADVSHRLHHIRGGRKKDWKRFFEAMDADPPSPVVAEWVRNLSPDYEVVIVSGRPEGYGDRTIAWLRRHHIPFSHILMRRDGDHRPDHIVKQEILDRLPRKAIAFVIDDRNSVCEMWRRNGLRCIQVAEGNF
jgi:NLI interacting factor-like phosphatase